MKLLLTSGGIKNPSIRDALVGLLGKPVAECSALCIPTAVYAMPGGAGMAWRLINGQLPTPLCELGWKSLGVLELTALPSIEEEHWVPVVRETDALLVGGGDPLYLCHWMRQSGLAGLFPSLPETVYVGVSAGSMVMAPRIGEDFVRWTPTADSDKTRAAGGDKAPPAGRDKAPPAGGDETPPAGGDETLGLVDFAMFPHLDHEMLPENTMTDAERWAAGLTVPAYAIDDQTAIKVTDGAVEVVTEGHWRLFTP